MPNTVSTASPSRSTATPHGTVDAAGALLTVSELATLLQANEKKIYQLAASGQLPGTKITGRWLFPRRLIDAWLREHCHDALLADRLLLVGVADRRFEAACRDTALDWQSSGLLGYSPTGLRHGLAMLEARRADGCLMHWGHFDAHARQHLALLRHRAGCEDWVIVRVAIRDDGLLLRRAAGSDRPTFENLLRSPPLRWRLPAAGSAARRYFDEARGERGIRGAVSECGNDDERCPAAALHADEADVAVGSAFDAYAHGLEYLSLGAIGLDLVTTRRGYFRTPMQTLLERVATPAHAAATDGWPGYRPAPSSGVLPVREHDGLPVADSVL